MHDAPYVWVATPCNVISGVFLSREDFIELRQARKQVSRNSL